MAFNNPLSPNEAPEPIPLDEKPFKCVEGDTLPSVTGGKSLNNYPVVQLDVDVITDSIAGRLATSLLGHVLFLKNQIPFPVMRLERMPRPQNTKTRVDKQRTDFLESFDTIASHMDSTFSALSTALSRCSKQSDSEITRAYLAILVGPSLISAKSKVVLGIEGFEKRVWGNQKNVTNTQEAGEGEPEDRDPVAELDVVDNRDDPEDSESDEESDGEQDDDDEIVPSSPPLVQHSRASEQSFLQNAERLLSRTLAAADGDGRGLISETSPTQTHVLIRAPRHFSHPAWIPRQNISKSLNSMLSSFLDHSGVRSLSEVKRSKKEIVEGVWITYREGIQKEITATDHDLLAKPDDDIIWWSWEGKLTGFSDW